MSANAEIIAELRRVLNERDEAREQLDLTKRELGRWVDRETKAVRERDEWRDKFLALNQTAGELCNACGWAFRIPGEPCRCEVVKERDEARATIAQIRRVFGNALAFDDARGDVVKMAEIAYRGACDGDKAVGELQRAERERDEARAEVERLRETKDYLRTWLSSEELEGLRVKAAEHPLLWEEIHHLKAEVERLREMAHDFEAMREDRDEARAEADRWKRSCNVFRERDWPKAFQATVTSLEQEVSDAHEQLAKLRKLSKPWEGDAYRRGAEAMREACAAKVVEWLDHRWATALWLDKLIRELPIPEEQ